MGGGQTLTWRIGVGAGYIQYVFVVQFTQNDFLVVLARIGRMLTDETEVWFEAARRISARGVHVDDATHFRCGNQRHFRKLRLLNANVPI